MIGWASILLLINLILLAAGPAIGFVSARKRYGTRAKRCLNWLVVYYGTAIAVLIVHMWANQVRLVTPNRPMFVGVLLLVHSFAFLGPLVGGQIIAVAAVGSSRCGRCDYDLTGNTSGVCPECGSALAGDDASTGSWSARWYRNAWPRVRTVWLLSLVFYLVVMGLNYRYAGDYCPRCARARFERHLGWGVPFAGWSAIKSIPGFQTSWVNVSPLTPHLDPDGTCPHDWTDLGQMMHGLSCGEQTMREDPTRVPFNPSPELDQFVAARPALLAQCRDDLAAGQPCIEFANAYHQSLWPLDLTSVLNTTPRRSEDTGEFAIEVTAEDLASFGIRTAPVGTSGEFTVTGWEWPDVPDQQ